jgi:hypothetical protein
MARRGIVRSANNPVAGVAEYLVVNAFGLKRVPQSTKGYNAMDVNGQKYEIKSRRLTQHNPPRILGAIRDGEHVNFNFLARVLFNEDFSLYKACLIPHEIALKESNFQEHTNAHILELDDSLWHRSGVTDITANLQAVFERLK